MSTDILDHAVDTTFTCTENILTVQDYSRMWTEQVDRGGLRIEHLFGKGLSQDEKSICCAFNIHSFQVPVYLPLLHQ